MAHAAPMARVAGHEVPLAAVVDELVWALGSKNVAQIGGVTRTSAVAEWRRGTPPRGDREYRLRLAWEITVILRERYDPPTMRAWFWGAKAQFDDEAPIALLEAEGVELLKLQAPLLRAARAAIATASPVPVPV